MVTSRIAKVARNQDVRNRPSANFFAHFWLVAVVFSGCAGCTTAGTQQGDKIDETPAAIVQRIVRADYEGDRAALRALHDALPVHASVGSDAKLMSRIYYWRGFAYWRRALNGFNEGVSPVELDADLTQAIADFDLALDHDPGFLDARVGVISCLSNLLFIHLNDRERMNEIIAQTSPMVSQALESDPDHPRLLWVLGANRWRHGAATQAEREASAIATWQRGLESARQLRDTASSPLEPVWGEAELLMNLAWANMNRVEPDPDLAFQYATRALKIVPYWHYMRDILMPQIAQAR